MPAGSRVRVIRSQRAIDTANAALKRDILRHHPDNATSPLAWANPSPSRSHASTTPRLRRAPQALPSNPREPVPSPAKTLSSTWVVWANLTLPSRLVYRRHGRGLRHGLLVRTQGTRHRLQGAGRGHSSPYAAIARDLDNVAPFPQTALTATSVVTPAAAEGAPANPESSSTPIAAQADYASTKPFLCVVVTTPRFAALARDLGADVIYATTDSLDAANISPPRSGARYHSL